MASEYGCTSISRMNLVVYIRDCLRSVKELFYSVRNSNRAAWSRLMPGSLLLSGDL